MLIASILLLISSLELFAGTVDVDSQEYKIIKQAAKEYAVVLGSPTEIDGYQFDKNILTIKTKRANIVQEVVIKLPEDVVISKCVIEGGKLSVTYTAKMNISADLEKANKEGFWRGLIWGGSGGGVAGCILMVVLVVAL